jgi:sugar-specific transcriptional regulator TrmB
MRITTDRIGVLVEYGLTEYQARVYLALLEFPSMQAGSLAKASQVPRNRLYEVLEELQSLGLVEIILDETRKYRAKPLSEYLDRTVGDLRSRIGEIEARRDYLTVAFEPPALGEAEDMEAGLTRVVLGRRAVAREIDRLVDAARNSIFASASVGGSERVARHLVDAGKPEDPGLQVEVYLPRSAALAGGLERHGEALQRAVTWVEVPLRSIVFVADEREMLLVNPIPDDDRLRVGRDFGLLTTNPALVHDQLRLIRQAAAPISLVRK